MTMKTRYVSGALVVLALFVAAMVMLPVLGMVLLGLLTLLVPVALLLAPVLFALALFFLVGKLHSIDDGSVVADIDLEAAALCEPHAASTASS